MVTVKVLYGDTGKAAESAKVSLGFSGLLRGVTRDEFTDRNGDAHFDAEPGTCKVFVKGKKVHDGHLSGRVIVYI